jgi:hypothetical protein
MCFSFYFRLDGVHYGGLPGNDAYELGRVLERFGLHRPTRLSDPERKTKHGFCLFSFYLAEEARLLGARTQLSGLS